MRKSRANKPTKPANFHRYYRCTHAIKNGREGCSTGTLPAGEIERVVVEEVRGLAKDNTLLAQVLTEAHAAINAEMAAVRGERDGLVRERKHHQKELQQLVTSGKVESRIAELECQTVSEAEARAVFADFDGLWQSLIPREQARLLRLLISTVEYDGDAGTVSVTFRSTSIRSLIDRKEEEAA